MKTLKNWMQRGAAWFQKLFTRVVIVERVITIYRPKAIVLRSVHHSAEVAAKFGQMALFN